jgi:hypothetical protein
MWLMEHKQHLVNPEMVVEVEEIAAAPLLTPAEKRKNIRTLIKQVWLGETYTSVSVPVGCDLLTYDDVVSWYIEQKEVGTNHFKYCKQWLAGNVSALVYLYDMAGMTMPGIRKTIV